MALEDVLAAPVVRPVYIGFLDIKDDPVRGWTGPGLLAPTGTGDPDLDGETFLSAAGAVDITEFREDLGLGGPVTVTFAAGEMEDEAVFEQLVADRRAFQARKARFWLAFLQEDESAIEPEIEPMFTGVMVGASTERETGSPALISVTCDQDTQKAYTAPVRAIDHQVFYPTDTWSTFINDLARGPLASGSRLSREYSDPPGPRRPGDFPPRRDYL